MSNDTYRGWSISFEYGWCATHPDFDASWEGNDDAWADAERETPCLISLVEAHFEECAA